MARPTAVENSDRVEPLQATILAGIPHTECLAFVRTEWRISRDCGYELLKRAWTQIKADVDEPGTDRQELLAWSIQSWSGRDLRASVGWMTGFGVSSTVGDRTRC
ncbi:hypothetical protein [Synechococcus sp. WH 8020]|uniref:hypothetical protein n=1 Tax=Synechococcus sp. (strain WH8020) TaxID=32052 RepID=UPI0008FFB38E|nr:hypothetical protein [Synechococcus sp. WH 8020]